MYSYYMGRHSQILTNSAIASPKEFVEVYPVSSNLDINMEIAIASKVSTFDIGDFDKSHRKAGATFKQCRGLAAKWAKSKVGMDWQKMKRIQACLYAESKAGKLSFEQAHNLFKRKTLPKVYADKIKAYLVANTDKAD